MLLRWNGGYSTYDWQALDPNDHLNDEQYDDLLPQDYNEFTTNLNQVLTGVYGNYINDEVMDLPFISWRNDENHYRRLRNALIDHFWFSYTKGKVFWPRNFNKSKQELRPINFVARAEDSIRRNLYSKKSTFIALDKSVTPPRWEAEIGLGLFSLLQYDENDSIAWFCGEEINYDEVQRRRLSTPDAINYTINCCSAKANTYFDCYRTCKAGKCMASLANSPTSVQKRIGGGTPEANAKIAFSVDLVTTAVSVRLLASKRILPGTEICWHYGSQYWR